MHSVSAWLNRVRPRSSAFAHTNTGRPTTLPDRRRLGTERRSAASGPPRPDAEVEAGATGRDEVAAGAWIRKCGLRGWHFCINPAVSKECASTRGAVLATRRADA